MAGGFSFRDRKINKGFRPQAQSLCCIEEVGGCVKCEVRGPGKGFRRIMLRDCT